MPSSPFIVPNRINGIDVCSLQKDLDAEVVAKHGFRFAYIKSSQYSSIKDLQFGILRDKLQKAGLAVGAYHFAAHDSDPAKQMEFFYRASEGLGSGPGELPPMLDWEFCTPSKYKDHPKHCVGWLETALGAIQELWYPNNKDRINKRYGVVYTYPNYSSQHQPDLGNQVWIANHPLCFASYSGSKALPPEGHVTYHNTPKPWSKAILTQYSGNVGMQVPGVVGACDRDLFNGNETEWKELLGL